MSDLDQCVMRVDGLVMLFGGLIAVNNVSLNLSSGSILAVIGPNGAGKTTLFNCLTGFYRPRAGTIAIRTDDGSWLSLVGQQPHKFTMAGIARTFQNTRLFKEMSVLENVMVARHCRMNSGIFGAIFRSKAVQREEQACVTRAYELLAEVNLTAEANNLAGNLPYAAMRRLEIARALATEPKVLMLDEPAAGMNPQETKELELLLGCLQKDHDFALLLIEHDMRLIMSLAQKILVLNYGSPIAEGTPAQVRSHPEVLQAYLGTSLDA